VAKPCSVSVVTEAAEWEALFSRVEQPHMTQSWAYGEARQTLCMADTGRRIDAGGWHVRRLVFERGGEPVAICQLFDKTLGSVWCASRLNRGPLFLGTNPEAQAIRDVYCALRAHYGHLRRVLVLEPALPAAPENSEMLADLGFRSRCTPGACSDRVDLRPDEEQIRKNLTSAWRNRLRAAERSGLQIGVSQSTDDLEWMIARHVENMKEKAFSWPPPALIRALYRAAPDDLVIFQARLAEAAVGGLVAYQFGHVAEYYIAWMGREGRKVNVGNFLYWQAALEMRRRGCQWLDLGGKREGATEPFKRGMRGVEYRLLNEWLVL
jgi:hypothetical protein